MGWATAQQARETHRLSDVVSRLVKLRRASGGFTGLCPFHQEKTPSFHVSDRRGTFKCFGCGAWGDVIDFVMLTQGLDFTAALKVLVDDVSLHDFAPAAKAVDRHGEEDELRRIRHAHEIWLRRQPLEDTLAERYLSRVRRLPRPYPETLGYVAEAWCSPLGAACGALVAPLQDENGHVTAIQQIFLCPETGDAWRDERGHRLKRTVGVMRKGAVRLSMPDTVLGLAGSVEDGLAAQHMFSIPVWAVCGETRLASVWLPPEVEEVVIFADADDTGRREAQRAAVAHFKQAFIQVHYPEQGKDWAEQLEKRNVG